MPFSAAEHTESPHSSEQANGKGVPALGDHGTTREPEPRTRGARPGAAGKASPLPLGCCRNPIPVHMEHLAISVTLIPAVRWADLENIPNNIKVADKVIEHMIPVPSARAVPDANWPVGFDHVDLDIPQVWFTAVQKQKKTEFVNNNGSIFFLDPIEINGLWFRCLPQRIKRKMLAGEQGEKEKDTLHPSERTDDVRKHWDKLKVENVMQERGENEVPNVTLPHLNLESLKEIKMVEIRNSQEPTTKIYGISQPF
ncbi:hypothetical protein DUI87_15451 [Hirundo rustica rustica]|uniref:Uncharacterized protein n=1 Tax=Hirundo rustica rustica TaxID=333673 RepID=A0A3M0K3W0_HIRRU|nr:hypothetical protein DUI87_15451 [Hirundo rustica rustica]